MKAIHFSPGNIKLLLSLNASVNLFAADPSVKETVNLFLSIVFRSKASIKPFTDLETRLPNAIIPYVPKSDFGRFLALASLPVSAELGPGSSPEPCTR